MSTPSRATAPPDSSPEALAARLNELVGRLSRRLRRSYHESRITPARLSALTAVVSDGPLTAGQLARSEQVSAPVVTRMLDALEGDGLVTRSADAGDRRIVRIQATERGRRAMAEGRAWQVRRLADEMRGLGARELATLDRALDALEELN